VSDPGHRPYKRTCCRCGNFRFAHGVLPDGHICSQCLRAALRDVRACPGCGRVRPLIGRQDGTPACRECAGITREFTCRHCGYEGEFCIARICLFCRNARKLAGFLDDGTGHPSKELAPLADYVRERMNPKRVECWINIPGTRLLLADLATGRLAVSHDALAAREDWSKAAYMRDLLVASGVLPPVDRQLATFESWLRRRLDGLRGHPHHRLLREFGLWHQLPRMRAAAAARPLRQTAAKYAKIRFRAAEDFLTWTSARGLRPADVAQADIDDFYNSHKAHLKQAIRAFLTWAIDTGHVPRRGVPVLRFGKGPGLTQDERIGLIRRFVVSDSLPLHLRAVTCLMLLYAQPLSRIVRLTASDVIRDDGDVYIQFGTPPAPLPEPFAALIEEQATASGGDSWLFPGRNAAQPRSYTGVYHALRDAGLPMRNARTSALRDLVLQAPAPVVADALGFHQTTTTRQFTAAGGRWSRYAATRRPGSDPADTPRRTASDQPSQ
jgi:hypothetical protein